VAFRARFLDVATARPRDLEDARTRFMHFIGPYSHG
jgi:hypothetical protein